MLIAILLAAFSGVSLAAPVPWLSLENASAQRVSESAFGGQMMVYQAGPDDAEPVVLIHGIGPGASDWRSLMKSLAADYRVTAVDMPGFGKSDKGNHLYSPEQLAVAVQDALAGRVDQPFSLVGYSLGAAVSMAYANLYPDDLSRLIIADMPGVLHRTVYTQFLGERGTGLFDAVTGTGAGKWVGNLLQQKLAELEASGMDPSMLLYSPTARQHLMGGDPAVIAALAASQHDFGQAIRNLRVPTLVIWGEDDAVTPLRTGQLIASTVPGARLKVFPGVGHMILADAPQAVESAIRGELSGRMAALPGYTQQSVTTETSRSESCNAQANSRFSGRLEKLTLNGCANAVVENANIGKLEIDGGSVHIVNSHIRDGIDARNAKIKITGGSVAGDPPLLLDASDLDAAGTTFESEYDLAKNTGSQPVSLMFSVAALKDASGHSRRLHEVTRLPAKALWP